MTLGELIERLKEYAENHGEECEVRLMTQQNWPFENRICGVVSTEEMDQAQAQEDEDDEAYDEATESEEMPTIYLVEGGQICYGRKIAWEAC
jgi:hypothetical protein